MATYLLVDAFDNDYEAAVVVSNDRIRSVTPLAGFVVHLEFTDGTATDVDLEKYLRGPIFEFPDRRMPYWPDEPVWATFSASGSLSRALVRKSTKTGGSINPPLTASTSPLGESTT